MRLFVVVLLLLASAWSCGRPSDRGGKPVIAVSIFPLHDVTRRIAGDRLEVMLVLPPGKSEHGYEPTPQETVELSRAKLAFLVGLGMDRWVEPVVRNARIVRLGQQVKTLPLDVEPVGEEPAGADEHGHDHGHGHPAGAPDPHFWMDPTLMRSVVDAIASELSALDPAGQETFARNAAAVKAAITATDAAIAQRAAAWTKRTIVTFHGSMTYFAKRYRVQIAAVVEPVAGTEPTAKYIVEVLAAIKQSGAAGLFSEPQLDRGPGETIAREANIPLGELDPVGGLAGRESYERLLTWNADQLEKVLK